MRFQPRTEEVGTVTIGACHYWLQRYYPQGGTRYFIHVFKKGALNERGLVFRNEDDFFDWADNAPQQIPLF